MIDLEEANELSLQFEKRTGLLPVAVQEYLSDQVLMIASTNKEAFDLTLRYGIAVFYSTSRKKIWVKGESSGNQLKVENILIDCDQDALVYQVSLIKGGVCHTFNKNGENRKSCFYRRLANNDNFLDFLEP